MPGLVFDNYTRNQNNNTTISAHSSWGPSAPRTTKSIVSSASNVDIDNANRWHALAGPSALASATIAYDYSSAQNFSSLTSITLTGDSNTIYNKLQLNLYDGTNRVGFLPSSSNSTSATWNIASISGVNLSNIVSLAFLVKSFSGVASDFKISSLSSI